MSSLLQWAFQSVIPSIGDKCIGFDDLLHCIKTPEKYAIIHTMAASEPILIAGTLTALEEESFMNDYLSTYTENQKTIVLYGRNSCDDSPRKKRAQLLSFGISDVYVYTSGMFEWVLLQDIYGVTEFPTTGGVVELLAYRPCPLNKMNQKKN